jgi:hypothetical protein
LAEQEVSTKQEPLQITKMARTARLKQLERIADFGASVFTVYGFVQALLIWQRLTGTSPKIVLNVIGIVIQGVPWDWMVSTVILLSARGIWSAAKTVARELVNVIKS